jgi:hypothetical protein
MRMGVGMIDSRARAHRRSSMNREVQVLQHALQGCVLPVASPGDVQPLSIVRIAETVNASRFDRLAVRLAEPLI